MKKLTIKQDVISLARNIRFAINIKDLLDEIDELERLAEIGKETEQAFEEGYGMIYEYFALPIDETQLESVLDTTEKLLNRREK